MIPMPSFVPAALRLTCALCLLAASGAQAAGTAVAPLPLHTVDSPDVSTVHSVLVAGNRLFIGGEFDSVRAPDGTTTTARKLVAIDLAALTVLWTGEINIGTGCGVESAGAIHALALSPGGGTLYVGGDFDCVRGVARDNLAALSANTGTPLPGWGGAGGPDAPVRALARTADGQNLYVGGEFGQFGDAGAGQLEIIRRHIASVNPQNGAVLPWDPDADDDVLALAVDEANAQVFAGGTFDTIGGVSPPALAAIGMTTAVPHPWNAGLGGGDEVRALLFADGRLYLGGAFAQLAGQPRANLGAFTVDGADIELGALDAPVAGGPVHALGLDPEGLRLYLGGAFTTAGGEARDRLAALGLTAAGAVERVLAWSPGPDGDVLALTVARRDIDGAPIDRLYAGGAFDAVGLEAAEGIAALPVTRPVTLADPPEGGHQGLTNVSLDCEAVDGVDCEWICHTVDGAEPSPPVSADCSDSLPVVVPIPQGDAITTLRFFAQDVAGNREAVRTGRYALDDEAPVTTVEPPPPADGEWYGADTLVPLEMSCDDNLIEFGCATHYTLDGAEPTTASPRYTVPVSLASLLPPAETPALDIESRAATFTLRVFSVDDAGLEEEIRDLVYRVDLAAPVVAPSRPAGTYVAPLMLALECDDGIGSGCADLYYTTDNSTPSPSDTRYDGVIELNEATILRVLAVDHAGNASTQTLGVYALSEAARATRSGVGSFGGVMLLSLLALAALRFRRISGGSGACR